MRQFRSVRLILLGSTGASVLLLALSPEAQAYPQGNVEIMAPSYYGMAGDPTSYWQSLENNWPANQPNGTIIVNPADGPGTSVDSTLWNNMDALGQQRNWYYANYLGYIDMPVGFSTSTVSSEADAWASPQMYGSLLYGFFFDDVARDQSGSLSTDVAQIEWAINNVLSRHWVSLVVMNAAGPYTTTAGLFYCVRSIVESYGANFEVVTVETYENATRSHSQNDINTHGDDFAYNGVLDWVYNYRPTYFAGLIHDGTAAMVAADVDQLTSYNIGFAFVTDQLESQNPWAPGPSQDVWSQLLAYTGSNVTYTYYGQPSVPPLSFTCPNMAP